MILIKKILCLLMVTGLPFLSHLHAQQGKIDSNFNTLDDGLIGDGFDKPVQTLFLQPDENLIVGGEYLSLNGIPTAYLTRLKPDGTIDENFDTGTGFNGKVNSTYVQSDGKIIVGGSFSTYNGVTCGKLIRLNSNGSVDTSFNTLIASTGTGTIYSICPQADGKIIIVGSFTKYNNTATNRIARILPNGSLDPTFMIGSGSSLNITNVRVLPNGKILLVGNFTKFNGIESNKIIRLNSDGSVDGSFNIGTGFNGDVNAAAVQSDGKIILGGSFTNYNEVAANRIIRINENGTIDNSFLSRSGIDGGAVQIIKTDAVGNIMVGGSFTGFYNGTDINRVILLKADGSINPNFDVGSGPATASVLALEVDSEGSWFIGGSFSVFDGQNQGKLAKVNSDGEQDIAYLAAGVGFNNSVLKIVSLDNKKTMVFGNFIKFNGKAVSKIARLLENGLIDESFNSGQTGASSTIKTAVQQSDGKIVFGGNFTKYNGLTCNRIARILPDGTIDNTFSSGAGFIGQVNTMALQKDGKIIVAGNFTKYNGINAGKILRLLPDGTRDPDFSVGDGADLSIETILIQPDGKILAAGNFNTFNGNTCPRLIRLNIDGSPDPGFTIGTGFEKPIYAMALQSDQKIILGGAFLTCQGTSQKRIVRLNANGTLDTSFDSGIGFNKGDVRSILIQPDDRILVGGTFSGTYKSTPSLRLIRLLKTGSFDSSFDAKLNNKLFAMDFTADYKLIIGGNFNSVSGISKHRIARLKLCLESTTWNSGSWSNGLPSGGKEVFFKDDYPNLTSANVCSCEIDEGKSVTLLEGNTLGIEFSYLGLGTLILENTASLYQSDDDMINTGIIHLKRKTTPILKFDFTFWSSPVSNQKLIDLSPNTLFDKYYSYDYVLKSWRHEQPSNIMEAGIGYDIRGPQEFSTTEPAIYEGVFKGIPNNGKINVEIGVENAPNLIGNPYPSAMDADVFLTKNASKLKGTLYFWTHNTPVTNNFYSSNDYAAYNIVGGVATRPALSSGVSNNAPDGTIAAGQSFFVRSSNAGTVEFNNSMRIAGRNSSFFKPGKNKDNNGNDNKIEKHRIWLDLKNKDGAFKQILVGYVQGATNSFDISYDAEPLNANQFVDFYSIVDNKKAVIQGRALPFAVTDSIVLGYKTDIDGDFTFSIDHQDELFNDVNVFLEDKDLNTIQNLKEAPYLFNSKIGTFNSRFVLRYTNKTLGNPDFENLEKNLFVSVKNKVIKLNSSSEVISEVSIYDVSGQLLYDKKKVRTTELTISHLQCSNQVLLVKTAFENGKSSCKKILY